MILTTALSHPVFRFLNHKFIIYVLPSALFLSFYPYPYSMHILFFAFLFPTSDKMELDLCLPYFLFILRLPHKLTLSVSFRSCVRLFFDSKGSMEKNENLANGVHFHEIFVVNSCLSNCFVIIFTDCKCSALSTYSMNGIIRRTCNAQHKIYRRQTLFR